MSTDQQIARRCKDCPTWTQTVCHHAFGVFWCVKSGDGEGCANPLDDVAEAWRKAGWKPGKGKSIPITLPVKEISKQEPPNTARKAPPKKESAVQLDFMSASQPPPLTDDDY